MTDYGLFSHFKAFRYKYYIRWGGVNYLKTNANGSRQGVYPKNLKPKLSPKFQDKSANTVKQAYFSELRII